MPPEPDRQESDPIAAPSPRDPAVRRAVFGIFHTWPDVKNAEAEVLQRVLAAAERVGAATVVLDNNGVVLWASPALDVRRGSQVPRGLLDFIVSLHFESPRVLDVHTYVTLWQPIEFYFDFGYQKSIDKLISHNDLISCDSDLADAHGLNLLEAIGRAPPTPLPRMFHTMPEPFLEPRIGPESTMFYIGINWERIGRPKGRFHDALVALDAKGVTDIYGPEKFFGVAPWEGFATYRGELPFDGFSAKHAINRSGICLALSSAAHKNVGIMSNRLFEGLAGGAAIVATPNALIDKHFADVVYLVDDSRGDAVLAQQLLDALRRIRSDPAEAIRRTLEGQRILRETCSLESSIRELIARTPERIADLDEKMLASAEVTLVLTYAGDRLDELREHLSHLRRQKRAAIDLHILCDERFARRHRDEPMLAPAGSIRTIRLHPLVLDPVPGSFDGIVPTRDRTGPTIGRILASIATPHFAFSRIEDVMFSGHLASLTKTLADDPGAMAACSGMILHKAAAGPTQRTLHGMRFTDFDSVLLVNGADQVGRFLFSSELLRQPMSHLMAMLDGEEHGYFRLAALLAGPFAQSSFASYLLDEAKRDEAPVLSGRTEHQRQFIRDAFSRDTRWIDRLSRGTDLPEFVYAHGPGAPIRTEDDLPLPALTDRIPLDQHLATARGQEGLRYLTSGFQAPDVDSVWLGAERGTINFALPDAAVPDPEDYDVALMLFGRRALSNGREQHCTVGLNGTVIGYHRVPEHPSLLRIPMPIELLRRSRRFQLELTADHADQVFDTAGELVDGRPLALRLISIGIFRRSDESVPVLEADELYGCGRGGRGADALVSNFYPPEEAFAWIAGAEGTLRFRLRSVPRRPRLNLALFGRASLAGDPVLARIRVNDVDHGEYVLGPDVREIEIDLAADALSGRTVTVVLTASHAEAMEDEDGMVADGRLLSVAVAQLGVLEGPPPDYDIPAVPGTDSSLSRQRPDLLPVLEAGVLHGCRAGEAGTQALVRNFYAAEEGYAWMAGRKGLVRFRLRDIPRRPQLRLVLVGGLARLTGRAASVRISVNGAAVGEYPLQPQRQTIVVDLASSDVDGGMMTLLLEGSHAEPVYDERGRIVDGRLLGLAICDFGVFDSTGRAAS